MTPATHGCQSTGPSGSTPASGVVTARVASVSVRTAPRATKTSALESGAQRGEPAGASRTGSAAAPGAIVDRPPGRANASACLSGAHAGMPVTAGGRARPGHTSAPATTAVKSCRSGAQAMSVVSTLGSSRTSSGWPPPAAATRKRPAPRRNPIVSPSADHAGLASRSSDVSGTIRPVVRSSTESSPALTNAIRLPPEENASSVICPASGTGIARSPLPSGFNVTRRPSATAAS